MWRTSLLFLVGVAFPLLLNGQSFTNSILGSAFSIAAAAHGFWLEQKPQYLRAKHVSGFVVGGLAMVWSFHLIATLPAAYEHQDRFNNRGRAVEQQKDQAKPMP